jgi:hypothetical protein
MVAYAIPHIAPLALLASTIQPTAYFAMFGYLGSDKYYLLFFAPLIWFVCFKRFKREVDVRRQNEAVAHDKVISWQKIIIAVKTYGYYFALCVIPFRLSWYHSFMQSGAGGGNVIEKQKAVKLSWPFWIGLSLIGYLIYSLFNWNIIAWGILWLTVCIAPFLNLYRMQQEIAERYCYVANIGVMLALSLVLPPVAMACFFGIYISMLLKHIPAYTDDYWLVEYSTMNSPDAWFAWHMRAHKRWVQQSYREALNMWVMAKMISPKEFKILFNIAVVLKILGNMKESAEYMAQAKANIIKGQEELSLNLIREYERAEGGKMPLLR